MLHSKNIINKIPIKKGILFADQIMVSGTSFLLGILLVRALGLENYGVFALLWMVVLFALGINQALITKPMLSLAPKMNPIESKLYLNNMLLLQIGLSFIIAFVGILLWLLPTIVSFADSYLTFIPILSGLLFFQMAHDYYRKRCFIEDKINLAFMIDAALCLGQLILIAIYWLQNQLTLELTLTLILAANIVSVLIAAFSFNIDINSVASIKADVKKQFVFSKWLLGTAILQWFSGNYFIIIGASIIGPVAVGALRMVQNIMGFFHIIFLSLENIAPIEAARQLSVGGWNAMVDYLKKMTFKIGIAFLALLVIISVGAPWIIELLYGEAYSSYSYVVLAYCGLYVFVFLSIPLQFALRTIEMTYPLFIGYISATLFSFLAANFFLENWGMNGLLAGLIITQLITFSTYAFYCWRKNRDQIDIQKSTPKLTFQKQVSK